MCACHVCYVYVCIPCVLCVPGVCARCVCQVCYQVCVPGVCTRYVCTHRGQKKVSDPQSWSHSGCMLTWCREPDSNSGPVEGQYMLLTTNYLYLINYFRIVDYVSQKDMNTQSTLLSSDFKPVTNLYLYAHILITFLSL